MAVEVKMPQLGLTMTEGTIIKWHKKEGDPVAKGDLLYEVETDKLNNEVESDADGTLLKIVAQEGDEIPVLGLLAYIGEPGEKLPEAPVAEAPAPAPVAPPPAPVPGAPVPPAPPVAPPAVAHTGRVIASPYAKKVAAEKGLDLSLIAGTGPNGRIVFRDVEHAQVAPPAPAPGAHPGVRREKMSGMRRAISKNMSHSWETSPVVHYNKEVDTTELAKVKDILSQDGRKISYTDLLAKIVSIALMAHPLVNCSVEGDEILYHDYVNMGIAVGMDEGLLVPVIKDAHHKGIGTISTEIRELSGKARYNELSPDEMNGGTFTITNMGMYGIDSFTPIVNQPEVAILGVNAIVQKPVVIDGEIVVRPMMNLSLTADHRVVDGTEAASFLKQVCTLIENPWQMLL